MAEDSTVDSSTTGSVNLTSSNVVSGTPNSLNTSNLSSESQGQGLGNQQVSNNVSSRVISPSSPSATPTLQFAAAPVRSNRELESAKAQFTKVTRMSVPSKELLSISEKAMTGAELKLEKVDYDKVADSNDVTIFQNNVKVENFVSKLKQHAIKFDAVDLFQKFPLLDEAIVDESDRFRNNKTIDLLDKWDRIGDNKELSIKDLADTIIWIKTFATSSSEVFLQDLDWMHHHLLNSMSEELREDIQGTLDHDFTEKHVGGPLTFALLIDKCINLSETAIETLKQKIISFSFKTLQGEDVETMSKHIKYAMKRLEHNNAITPSLVRSLFEVFQTTSVEAFNDIFRAWQLETSRRGATLPSYSDILDEATHQHEQFRTKNLWNGTNKKDQGSVFWNQSNGKNTRNDNDDSERPDWSEPKSNDKVSSNPDRFVRSVKGSDKKYCSKCKKYGKGDKLGRWGNHHTDEHRGPRQDNDTSASPTASANIAATTPNSTPVTREVTFQQALQRNASGTRTS